MTPEAFEQWLAEMHSEGIASSGIECAEKIGVHENSISNYKKRGCNITVAMACRAALHRMEPYGQ